MKINADKEIVLSELLLEEFKTASRSMVKKIILHGSVTINGIEVTKVTTLVNPGDVVEYTRFKAPRSHMNAPFPVIYEDDVLLVVDKPAGILTHAEKGSSGTSLYKELLEFIKERSKGKERIFVVHRLDREVSGIVLFVKTEAIQERVKEDWRETKKKYYALVNGKPPKEEDRLESWLKEGPDQKVFSVRQQEGAKLAVTFYKTVKSLHSTTLLEVQLETGRKNQIRVQLSDIGCPIVGDWRYGSKDNVKRRIRLHAYYFSMIHPATGDRVEFTSRMPRGFLTLKDQDERY